MADKCLVCGKTAYVKERITAEGKVFHTSCFKYVICYVSFRRCSGGFRVGYIVDLIYAVGLTFCSDATTASRSSRSESTLASLASTIASHTSSSSSWQRYLRTLVKR
jgi:hypothetical protein